MDGVLLVDKPAGITSAGVVARLKRLLKVKKAGHTGTLDPFATGLLVCCINKATRLAGILESLTKVYEGTLRLGIRTDTQDLTGGIISETTDLSLTESEIESTCTKFIGTMEQVPPMFSALKHRGVPLYKLARSGKGIVKPPRQITIYSLELLHIALPEVHFKVCCSKGAYIRTLASDIGDALGCGGHLAALRRLACGGFKISDAVTLDELTDAAQKGCIGKRVIAMNEALKGIPEIMVNDKISADILCGRPLTRGDLETFEPGPSPWLKVVDSQNRLIAVVSHNVDNEHYRYYAVFPN